MTTLGAVLVVWIRFSKAMAGRWSVQQVSDGAPEDDAEDGHSELASSAGSPSVDDAAQIVSMQLVFVLDGGSLTLLASDVRGGGGDEVLGAGSKPARARSGGTAGGVRHEALARITYEKLRVASISRPMSTTLHVQLGSFAVVDLCTRQLAHGFEHIIRRCAPRAACAASSPDKYMSTGLSATQQLALSTLGWGLGSLSGAADGGGDDGTHGSSRRAGAEEPVLFFKYVSNPPECDGIKADSQLVLHLDRLSIVYNPRWVAKLQDFLDVGDSAGSPALLCLSTDHSNVCVLMAQRDIFLDAGDSVVAVCSTAERAIKRVIKRAVKRAVKRALCTDMRHRSMGVT